MIEGYATVFPANDDEHDDEEIVYVLEQYNEAKISKRDDIADIINVTALQRKKKTESIHNEETLILIKSIIKEKWA